MTSPYDHSYYCKYHKWIAKDACVKMGTSEWPLCPFCHRQVRIGPRYNKPPIKDDIEIKPLCMSVGIQFTDEQYIRLYNQKVSDRRIAQILKVHHSTVRTRRLQLGLPTHYNNGRKHNG